MAAISEQKISLKLMVDTEKNKVVFAEADKDFVDILFSFLTIPLGTVARLLGDQWQLASIWSLTSLYQGVDKFDPKYLASVACKAMLLQPKNAAENLCKKLKLNIDDTEPTKYFVCSENTHLSFLKDLKCGCGYFANQEIYRWDSDFIEETGGCGGVFVKGEPIFIITDDLQVMPASYDSMLLLFKNLGISELKRLKQMSLDIGSNEITRLLELSLFSKSPFTDMFLGEEELHVNSHCVAPRHAGNVSQIPSNCQDININLVYRKSDNKVLYAEANKDFIDFLFSILTLPLGTVVELFAMNSSLTCIDNLYKSVNDLNVERCFRSDLHKATLLSPKLPPTYRCKNQPLDVKEMSANFELHRKRYRNIDGSYDMHLTLAENCPCEYVSKWKTVWLDPKSPATTTTSTNGYVKGPADFMVTDDLIVTPLSPISSLCLLNNLGVEFSALGQRVISVGKEEALCLLKASLTSTSALTSLNYNLRKPKQEN